MAPMEPTHTSALYIYSSSSQLNGSTTIIYGHTEAYTHTTSSCTLCDTTDYSISRHLRIGYIRSLSLMSDYSLSPIWAFNNKPSAC